MPSFFTNSLFRFIKSKGDSKQYKLSIASYVYKHIPTWRPTGPGGPGNPRGPSSPFCPNKPCCPLGPGSPSAPLRGREGGREKVG